MGSLNQFKMDNIKQFLVGTPYHQKLYFNIFKRYSYFENNALLSCVSKGVPTKEQLDEIFSYLNSDQKLLVSLRKGQRIFDHPRIICLYTHPQNFHQLFDTYVYYRLNYFDPHPRLFYECVFYNKKIIYINHDNIKDGGYFRYMDAMQNGLKNCWLDENDEIVKEMIR